MLITQVLCMTGRISSNDSELNKVISNELEGQLRWAFLKDYDIWGAVYGPNSMAKRLAKIKSDIIGGLYPEMLT